MRGKVENDISRLDPIITYFQYIVRALVLVAAVVFDVATRKRKKS
jgi:ABC-type xylose transport system permease subunit